MFPVLKAAFKDLGLQDKEISILWYLIQHGPLRAKNIAVGAGLNRTTGYGILKKLIKHGLVSTMERYGITEYQAIEPSLLINYIERYQSKLHRHKEKISSLLPQLESLHQKNDRLPHIQFFEGIEGIKQAYEDTIQNNSGKILYDLTGTDAVFLKMGKEWVNYYVTKRADRGIKCYDIAPDTSWSRNSKQRDTELNRVTKFIPAEYNFNSEVAIYDNKVGIFSFSQNHPLAVLIEDETISNTLKMLFRYIDHSIKIKTSR